MRSDLPAEESKYKIRISSRFKADLKKMILQHRDMKAMNAVVELLAADKPLPKTLKDHPLKGNYTGYRELHIENDWLLIYKKAADMLILVLQRTGTHAELFNN